MGGEPLPKNSLALWLSNRARLRTEDDLIDEPIPVRLVEVSDTNAARQSLVNTSGEITEVSALQSKNTLTSISGAVQTLTPLNFTASGAALGGTVYAWQPITPVTITADGTGVPPATVIVLLSATDLIDVMIWMTVSTVSAAGQYDFDFRTDPLAAVGGIAPVDPVWAPVNLPLAARETTPHNTYGHRMITTVISSAFGIAEGAAGDWPNAANVTFFGFYRYV